jgi:acyl carrier protein
VTETAIQERFRAYLASNALGNGGAIGPDDDLLADGVIDSMGVMELVSFIEDDLGVQVDDSEIVPENFRSIRALTEFATSKQNG